LQTLCTFDWLGESELRGLSGSNVFKSLNAVRGMFQLNIRSNIL